MGRRKSKGQKRKANKAPQNRQLEYRDDGQQYAQVLRMLGSGRCEVRCFDGITRLAHIRGSMRNKVWITMADFVLVGLREFQDHKCDIILKYTTEEVRNLKSYGELPEDTSLDIQKEDSEDETPFDFDDI